MSTEKLLEERQSTHGSFEHNAMISQRLKQILRVEGREYELMHVVHKECLDMICLKLSRILSGQSGFKDHWDDIAGYATLAAKQCEHKPNDLRKLGGVTYVPPPR